MLARLPALPVFATRLDGATLRIEPARAVTPAMADFVRANKPAIVAALQEIEGAYANSAADPCRSRTPNRAISYGKKAHEMPILSNSDDLVRVAAQLNAWNACKPVAWDAPWPAGGAA